MGKYKSYKATQNYTGNHQCHTGFYEIYPNLFMGAKKDVTRELCNNIDVLVPLDSLDAKIWDFGYDKEILYIPVDDYGTLPKETELVMIGKILTLLKEGRKIAIFCLGGHGRTGYIVGCILAELGVADPIKKMWDEYCNNAVESGGQLEAISEYLPRNKRIEFRELYKNKMNNYNFIESIWYGDYSSTTKEENDFKVFQDLLSRKCCGDCYYLINNECEVHGAEKGNADEACEYYLD